GTMGDIHRKGLTGTGDAVAGRDLHSEAAEEAGIALNGELIAGKRKSRVGISRRDRGPKLCWLVVHCRRRRGDQRHRSERIRGITHPAAQTTVWHEAIPLTIGPEDPLFIVADGIEKVGSRVAQPELMPELERLRIAARSGHGLSIKGKREAVGGGRG